MAVRDAKISELVDRICTLPAQDLTNLVEADIIRKELGKALKKHAQSEDHASRIIDYLMESRWRPTPVQIHEAAEQVPVDRPAQLTAPKANCVMCGGSGWKIVERGGLTGATECACRRA
jgi:hypothetical protein